MKFLILLSCATSFVGMSGCVMAVRTADVREALVHGDHAVIASFTETAFGSNLTPSLCDLMDSRPVEPAVIVRIPDDAGGQLELRVSQVGEYFMCILGATYKISGLEILGEEGCATRSQCEPCNSQVFPLTDAQRQTLRNYWARRLGLHCPPWLLRVSEGLPSGGAVRFAVTDTHPQALEGVSVVLIRESGTRVLLGTTDSSGNCEVDDSVLRAAGRGILLFCREKYFCGALDLDGPRFLEFREHLVVLAPFAIS